MTQECFSFSILTDTHIRSPQGDHSSPYPVNDRANDRARFAVSLLRQFQGDFTIHLGDMVHPLPHMAAYRPAAEEAQRLFTPLRPNLYFVPGNHDAGDKPSDVSPAGAIDSKSVANYEAFFSKSHYKFEHKGCVFIVINSSLVNSQTEEENIQRNWLTKTMADAQGKRIFLFSHYPPFIHHHDEDSHYDNYAEPGRSWLLKLAADANVEAIFSGHVHHFFINEYRGVMLYCLPATSFTRQDFSVLFRGLPTSEFGRDDREKFGITSINIDEKGHRVDWVPTGGAEQKEGDKTHVMAKTYMKIPNLIPSMRHHWYEPRALPANGPMEEFSRKIARNDYPILRLFQLGVKRIRIPLVDLVSDSGSQRIALLRNRGLKFIVFAHGAIDANTLNLIKTSSSCIDAVELAGSSISDLNFTELGNKNIPFWFSPITTSATQNDRSKPFAHTVTSGCFPNDMDRIAKQLEPAGEVSDARLVVQCPWSGDEMANSIIEIVDRWRLKPRGNLKLAVNVRLSPTNPADENRDADKIAKLLRLLGPYASANLDVAFILDTFETFDRGYHARLGLLDTLSNISDWYPKE